MGKIELEMRTWRGGRGNPLYIGFTGEGVAQSDDKTVEVRSQMVQPIQLNIRKALVKDLNLPDNFKLSIDW